MDRIKQEKTSSVTENREYLTNMVKQIIIIIKVKVPATVNVGVKKDGIGET